MNACAQQTLAEESFESCRPEARHICARFLLCQATCDFWYDAGIKLLQALSEVCGCSNLFAER